MKKLVKAVLGTSLILSLFITLCLPMIPVQAASKKTKLSNTSVTIPVGKQTSKTHWYANKSGKFNTSSGLKGDLKITVENKKKGATYTFISSNKKVVTIGSSGGYLTGVKAGTATITCKQKLKGKTTVIGKCKVKVVNATVSWDMSDKDYPIGDYVLAAPSTDNLMINYRNPDATYTYETDSADLKITETKLTGTKAHDYFYTSYVYIQKISAKATGTYNVTIKEKYKGKVRTLGTYQITIKPESLEESYEMKVNDSVEYPVNEFIKCAEEGTEYSFEIISDSDILGFVDDVLIAFAEGTAQIQVTNNRTGKVIGTITVTIVSVSCEEIDVPKTVATYVGCEEIEELLYVEVYPDNTTESLEITSSDPSILEITVDEEGYYIFTPKKEGVVTVTYTCGSVSVQCEVTVYASEEEYEDETYEGDEEEDVEEDEDYDDDEEYEEEY